MAEEQDSGGITFGGILKGCAYIGGLAVAAVCAPLVMQNVGEFLSEHNWAGAGETLTTGAGKLSSFYAGVADALPNVSEALKKLNIDPKAVATTDFKTYWNNILAPTGNQAISFVKDNAVPIAATAGGVVLGVTGTNWIDRSGRPAPAAGASAASQVLQRRAELERLRQQGLQAQHT